MRIPRRWPLALLVVALAHVAAVRARADDVVHFLYRPGEVPQSRVYVYRKSNLDGSDPQQVEVYVAAEDRVELWQAPHAGRPAGHAVAWINWLTCGIQRVEWWDLPAHHDPVLRWAAVTGADERSFDTHTPVAPPRRTVMHWRPWHLYGTALATLGMTLGHLVAAPDTFRIGLAAPDTAGDTLAFRDHGEARFAFRGEETHAGEVCRMFDVTGEGVDRRGGSVAVRRRDGFLQEVELGLPDEPGRSGLRLVLVKASHTSEGGWSRRLASGR